MQGDRWARFGAQATLWAFSSILTLLEPRGGDGLTAQRMSFVSSLMIEATPVSISGTAAVGEISGCRSSADEV